MSWKAPPSMEISSTPPSYPSAALEPDASRLKLWRNESTAAGLPIGMDTLSRCLSETTAGSSTKAAFGAVSGVVVVVTQKGAGLPGPLPATQPDGRVGAVTA